MDDCSIGYGWDHSVVGHCLAQKEGAVYPSLSWSARKGAAGAGVGFYLDYNRLYNR
jgi:hypothetical protein